jgi:serine/threonine-protein kinase RsbW
MTSDNVRVVEIHIPSELGFEKVAMASALTLARKMGFSEDRLEDLRTAVGEACINAIEHGNSMDLDVKVMVVLKVEPQRVEVNVIDRGDKPIPESIPDRADRKDFRGMGMFLIHQLMDEVKIKSEPGRNEIQMVINLEK